MHDELDESTIVDRPNLVVLAVGMPNLRSMVCHVSKALSTIDYPVLAQVCRFEIGNGGFPSL